MINNFFNKYFKEQKRLLSLNQSTKNKLENVKKYLEFIKKNKIILVEKPVFENLKIKCPR